MRNTQKISTFLTKNIGKTLPNKTNEELEIINYGLETIIMNLYKFIIIMGLAFILHITTLVLITMFVSGSLRFFTSGVHAKNWYVCLVMSIFNFIAIVLISVAITIPLSIASMMILFSYIIIYIYAPADTKSKPMVNPKKRKIHKSLSLIYATVLLLGTYIQSDLVLMNITVISIFLIAVYITPFFYGILGQTYANYKNYPSS